MPASNRGPWQGVCPILSDRYPAHSELGIVLRKGDANLRLKEMAEAEESIRQQEAQNAAIAHELERLLAEHRLDMQYPLQFGVFASERETFRQILEEVAHHGGLSLRQAADLTHAQCLAETGQKPLE